jgi:streptomycin 6-kinase
VTGPPDLESLVHTAREVAAAWDVELGEPFALSRYSYVASAGEDAVLKVTPPEDDESDEEADALELWGGRGAVRLLRRDRDRRALLLQRARPGTDISELPDAVATAIVVEVGTRLWRHAEAPFRWIGDYVPHWLDRSERSEQEGCELVPLARQLYASLEVGREVLVHGDLHHHNILRAGEQYLAIDAKAMLGEPEYDVPSFLRNPRGLGYRMELPTTERRIAAFAAAGLDEERMRKWAIIRCACLGADEDEVRVLRALIDR